MSPVRHIALLLSVLALCITLTGCASAGGGEEPEPGLISGTGTIEYLDIEGGCWMLRTDEGRAMSPRMMPANLRTNGLRVTFTAREEPGVMTSCMVGTPVTLLSAKPLEGAPGK